MNEPGRASRGRRRERRRGAEDDRRLYDLGLGVRNSDVGPWKTRRKRRAEAEKRVQPRMAPRDANSGG